MNSQEAEEFLKDWFEKVWMKSSVHDLKHYYDPNVKVTANGNLYSRSQLIEHCEWCKENEKISKIDFLDVVAEGLVIAFRFKYEYDSKNKKGLTGENIGIMHLNKEKKIIQINVKSSEKFVTD